MKPSNSLATVVFITCLLLLPNVSSATSTPSHTEQFSSETGNLPKLIKVAAAKEPTHLILVEKNLHRLRVLEYGDDSKIVAEYPIATGENSGIKEVNGDSKTPEGIYFITKIFKDDKVSIFGDKAVHLDYPNFFTGRQEETATAFTSMAPIKNCSQTVRMAALLWTRTILMNWKNISTRWSHLLL